MSHASQRIASILILFEESFQLLIWLMAESLLLIACTLTQFHCNPLSGGEGYRFQASGKVKT
jgi:hypothetical protein